MRFHSHSNIKITVWSTPEPGLALAVHDDGLSVIYPGRNFNRNGTFPAYTPCTAAAVALIFDYFSCPSACGTCTHCRHPTAGSAYLSSALTGRAGFGSRSGFCPATFAGIAQFIAVNLKAFFAAFCRFLKGDSQFITQIISGNRTLIPVHSGTHSAVEQLVKNISHAAHTAKIESSAEGVPSHTAHRIFKSELIISGPLIRIAEHLIGLVQFLKAFNCFFVVRMQIRMAFFCLLPICSLNFLFCGFFVHTEYFVIVALICQTASPLSQSKPVTFTGDGPLPKNKLCSYSYSTLPSAFTLPSSFVDPGCAPPFPMGLPSAFPACC